MRLAFASTARASRTSTSVRASRPSRIAERVGIDERTCVASIASSSRRASFVALSARADDDDETTSEEPSSTTTTTSRPTKPSERRKSPVYDGGKYGMGARVDKALDATTNQAGFVAGGIVLTMSAVLMFLFGPRPPTEY